MSQNTYRKPEKSFQLPEWLPQLSLGEVIHFRFLPQIVFIAVLCILYIANRHRAEKKIRAIEKLEVQVEDLRADYTTLKADYMVASRHSQVSLRARTLGLHTPAEFPKMIYAKE